MFVLNLPAVRHFLQLARVYQSVLWLRLHPAWLPIGTQDPGSSNGNSTSGV
jgi:hypothetical protein